MWKVNMPALLNMYSVYTFVSAKRNESRRRRAESLMRFNESFIWVQCETAIIPPIGYFILTRPSS